MAIEPKKKSANPSAAGTSNTIIWNASSADIYNMAMYGKLASSPPSTQLSFTVRNTLQCPLDVFYLDEAGNEQYWLTVGPNMWNGTDDTIPWWWQTQDLYTNSYYVVRTQGRGSFAAVFLTTEQAGDEFLIVPESLISPNCLGPVPTPTQLQIVPGDTPRVLVGASLDTGLANFIIREQMWRRDPNSFSLADGESVTISYTITSGKTETSSSESDVSAQLSASASAGWGPVSASISASLTKSSRSSHEVTISEQTTQFHSNTCKNSSGFSQMYIRWQMMDIISIVPVEPAPSYGVARFSAASCIEVGLQPVVTSGPWNINDLPGPATPPNSLSQDEQVEYGRRLAARRLERARAR